jgi:hypothetical protein
MRPHRVARVRRAGHAVSVAVAAGFAVTALLFAVLLAGCSSDGDRPQPDATSATEASGSTDTPSTDTLVTDMGMDLDLTWSLAGGLSAADTATISDALRKRGAHMLFPAGQPEWVPASSSAEFLLYVTIPTAIVSPTVWTHDKDGGVLLSVDSAPTAPDRTGAGGQATQVRGQPGQVYQTPGAVTMIEWTENGQFFHAELGAVSLDQALEWLKSWRSLP